MISCKSNVTKYICLKNVHCVMIKISYFKYGTTCIEV